MVFRGQVLIRIGVFNNIVREKLETCYSEDFCDAMEELVQVAYMDLSFDD